MDYEIKLKLNAALLKKYGHGFGYDTTRLDYCIDNNERIDARFIYEVKNQGEGMLMESEFKLLVEEYDIQAGKDDLFYYILCANESALEGLNRIAEMDQDGKPKALKQKAKELAKLFLLYRDNKDKHIHIKITPQKGESLTIKSDMLTSWIHTVIKEAAINNEFASYGPEHYLGFLIPNQDGTLNYDQIESVANMPIGAISIDYKRCLTQFILTVNDFVYNENIFEVRDGVRYSSTALKFIYQICLLFGLLPDEDRNSTDVDYMHGLIANYHKQYPDS